MIASACDTLAGFNAGVCMFSALLLVAAATAGEYRVNGSASATEVVELQLYSGVDVTDDNWYVEAKIGDKPVLLQLATRGAGAEGYGLVLSAGAAKRVGVKVAGKEGDQTAMVQLALGSATVSGKAAVGKVKPNVDGKISISAFPQLAWAIDATAGKVRVGPSGSDSVAAKVGAGAAYVQVAMQHPKIEKDNVKVSAQLCVVDATVSGVKLPVELGLGDNTEVDTEVDGAGWFRVAGVDNPAYPLPAVDGQKFGEMEIEWREVGLGGLTVHSGVRREGAGLAYRFGAPGRIGQDVLKHFDIGVDAGTHQVSFRANNSSAAVSYGSVLRARLQADLDGAVAAPPPDPDAAKAALTGKITPLQAFAAGADELDVAVDLAKRLTENDGTHCSSWHTYGRALMEAGKYSEAVEPLTKAATLYQAWGPRPLAERTELAATEAKRSKEADFDGVWSQPSSCFTAWSDLAVAQVAAGNVAAVAELYPKYEDLDASLPRAAGNALLLAGNLAGAEAAYRQAIQLSYNQDGWARGGMMLATRGRSLELALAQFEGPLDEEHGTLRYWAVYAELLRQSGGAAHAVEALGAILAQNPWNVPGWLTLAAEQAAAGKDNAAALQSALALVDDRLRYTPNSPGLHAWRGEALRLQGKLADAASEAEKATTAFPTNPVGWYVRARVAESAGDSARAAELRKRAGQAGAADPLYASLLAKP